MAELMYDVDGWPDDVFERLSWLLRDDTANAFRSYSMSCYITNDSKGLDMPPANGFALSLLAGGEGDESLKPRIYAFGVYSIGEDEDGNIVTNFTPWLYVPDAPWSGDDNSRYKGLMGHQDGPSETWAYIDDLGDVPPDNQDNPDGNVGELP